MDSEMRREPFEVERDGANAAASESGRVVQELGSGGGESDCLGGARGRVSRESGVD